MSHVVTLNGAGVWLFDLRLIIGSFLNLKFVPGGQRYTQSERTGFVPPFFHPEI